MVLGAAAFDYCPGDRAAMLAQTQATSGAATICDGRGVCVGPGPLKAICVAVLSCAGNCTAYTNTLDNTHRHTKATFNKHMASITHAV